MRKYWSVHAQRHSENFTETSAHVRELVTDAVKRQLVSDVPLCCFLSGGLDSSIISAIAAGEFQKQGKRLSTWSIDYKDNHKNFHASSGVHWFRAHKRGAGYTGAGRGAV